MHSRVYSLPLLRVHILCFFYDYTTADEPNLFRSWGDTTDQFFQARNGKIPGAQPAEINFGKYFLFSVFLKVGLFLFASIKLILSISLTLLIVINKYYVFSYKICALGPFPVEGRDWYAKYLTAESNYKEIALIRWFFD